MFRLIDQPSLRPRSKAAEGDPRPAPAARGGLAEDRRLANANGDRRSEADLQGTSGDGGVRQRHRRNRGLRQFNVRGLAKAKAVILWYVIAHNLMRGVALRAEREKVS